MIMKNNRYGQLKEIVTKNVMKDIDEVGHVSTCEPRVIRQRPRALPLDPAGGSAPD